MSEKVDWEKFEDGVKAGIQVTKELDVAGEIANYLDTNPRFAHYRGAWGWGFYYGLRYLAPRAKSESDFIELAKKLHAKRLEEHAKKEG